MKGRKSMTKKRFKTGIIYGGILIGFFLLLVFPEYSSDSARNGLEVCFRVILPTLFPFFVLSSLIIDMNIAPLLGKLFSPFMRRLFNVPKDCGVVFLLGLLSGFPVGAKMTSEMYEKGLCSKNEADRLLCFSNNPSPGFVISVVGGGILGSVTFGWLLFISQTVAAVISGILIAIIYKVSDSKHEYIPQRIEEKNNPSFALCFTEAVKSGLSSVLNVCAFIVFFLMLTGLFEKLGVWSFLASLFSFTGISPEVFKSIAAGFMEITSGASSVANLSPRVAIPLLSMILGWSGISVHFQVFAFSLKSGLSTKPYLLSKVMQAFIGGCLSLLAVIVMGF